MLRKNAFFKDLFIIKVIGFVSFMEIHVPSNSELFLELREKIIFKTPVSLTLWNDLNIVYMSVNLLIVLGTEKKDLCLWNTC